MGERHAQHGGVSPFHEQPEAEFAVVRVVRVVRVASIRVRVGVGARLRRGGVGGGWQSEMALDSSRAMYRVPEDSRPMTVVQCAPRMGCCGADIG